MQINFRTSLRGAPIVFAIGAAIILISMLSSQNVTATDPTFLGITVIYFLIIADIICGNYVTIYDSYLSTIDWFVFKQSVNLDEISHISYSPQFIGGMGAKMLTVYFKKGNQIKALNVGSNHFFSQQTLANIVHEIVRKNSRIQLDETVRTLMDKHLKQPR